MKRITKKAISLLLTFLMLVSMFPMTVLAEDDVEQAADSYGRRILASMDNSEALLYAYDSIVAGIEAAESSINVYNGVNAISIEEFLMVMDIYGRQNPQHFWVGDSFGYGLTNGSVSRLSPTYLWTGDSLELVQKQYEEKVKEVLSGISSSMSEYEKELYIHDKLASMITYVDTANAHNAYGALVEGKAVCEGYAEVFQDMLSRVGIEGFLAVGSSINPGTGSPEGHEWNYVKINGKYYHVDLTWNDQDTEQYHMYFNQTDAIMSEDHMVDETCYPLPVCDSVDAFYFYGKDEYLDTYDAKKIAGLMKKEGQTIHVYIPGDVDAFKTWFFTSKNIRDIASELGLTGGFSYGASTMGREMVLRLIGSGHKCKDNLNYQMEVTATCELAGTSDYYACSCGKKYKDASATELIIDMSAIAISPLGHDYSVQEVDKEHVRHKAANCQEKTSY